MLKIVPDPPHPHLFEDTLVQTTEHVNCALAVTHQSLLLSTRSPGSFLLLAAMHELESVRTLLEALLAQVQQVSEAQQTVH